MFCQSTIREKPNVNLVQSNIVNKFIFIESKKQIISISKTKLIAVFELIKIGKINRYV